jgi:hypothetical protein
MVTFHTDLLDIRLFEESGIRPDNGSLKRTDYPAGYKANRISDASLNLTLQTIVPDTGTGTD